MRKKNYCLDCKKQISRKAKRCRKCRGIINRNPKNYCLDCNIEINYKSKRCKSCANKGKLNPYYKENKLFKYCIDCNKQLTNNSAIRCMKCQGIYHSKTFSGKNNFMYGRKGKNNPNWKGGKSKCIDCGKESSSCHSKRCRNCHSKFMTGKNNPAYKDGRSLKKYFCVDCGKKLSNFYYKRCLSCAKKGKLAPLYIDGRTSAIFYCLDCGIKISGYQAKRCYSCANKGELSNSYIDGRTNKKRYCIDCGKKLKSYKAKRCRSCSIKCIKLFQSGKNNPMYGKVAKGAGRGKGSYYKGVWMRSSWEIKYAKWLDENRLRWKYEYKRFDLGDCTYTPDFYLSDTNEWIEIKGYYSNKNKKKMDIFQQKYPFLNFEILQKKDLELLGIKL